MRKTRIGQGSTGGLVLAGLTIATLVLIVLATESMGQGGYQGGSKSERFDLSVREDFFSGFAGDMKALARGMMKCEQALAKDPQNAEALVWHGSGLSYDAKRAFMAGDVEKGRKIQAQAEKEMNDAVAMRPDDVERVDSSGISIPFSSFTCSFTGSGQKGLPACCR